MHKIPNGQDLDSLVKWSKARGVDQMFRKFFQASLLMRDHLWLVFTFKALAQLTLHIMRQARFTLSNFLRENSDRTVCKVDDKVHGACLRLSHRINQRATSPP